jgi:ComF family protein
MPKTAYETIPDNPVARIFWGRVPLHAASACYFFAKKGRIQPLIHSLKYRSNKGIGLYLGQQLGTSLIEAPLYQDVQLIVPVPLHPKKKHIRGYNQAEVIANGMAKVMKLPVVTDNLIRSVATETQTKKSRDERWQNVKNIFTVTNPSQFTNSHVLLVDDVITTGSTIEACVTTLLEATHLKVSVATVACATV